ncbi:MAG: putative cytokinetic ring protein SteA [Bacillota bacterium]
MLRGRIYYNEKTKNLVKSLTKDDIALISHQDIDRLAAKSLIKTKIKAIINVKRSISGNYPTKAPLLIINEGIKIYDNCNENIINLIKNGDLIEIRNNKIYKKGKILCSASILTKEKVIKNYKKGLKIREKILSKFMDNTLNYLKKEKEILLNIKVPNFKNIIENQEVLIITRKHNSLNDLQFFLPYLKKEKVIIIAVDGGADYCLQLGLIPDIIVGDMDSVSSDALFLAKHIVAHAYLNGKCPALKRLNKLKIKAVKFFSLGTSEDIALLLAYKNKAKKIFLVGGHKYMIDFLEKNRKGMGSTLFIRTLIGEKLHDLSGISQIKKDIIDNV